MPNLLEYPIRLTHKNLALRQDKQIVAYYRVPNTPITITDTDKQTKHKKSVAGVIRKLAKYKNFDISLIPRDYLLGEKFEDFSEDFHPEAKSLGEAVLSEAYHKLTQEMEIPYQFDWLIGVVIDKELTTDKFSTLVNERVTEVSSNLAGLFGFVLEDEEDWYQPYLGSETSLYQILSPLKAKRLSDEELFYYQRMQFLRYIPHARSEVVANRSSDNVTDTLLTALAGGFLRLDCAYGTSFLTVLPIGRFSTIFNGFHLGEFVQRLNFPVELKIQAEFIDKNRLKGTMGRSNTRYSNIMQEAYNTNTVQQDEVLMGNLSLKDLMKKVGNNEELIEYGAHLIVAGSSLSQLRQRRQTVLNFFEDMQVQVSEASYDTPYLFQALLYGQSLGKTTRKWNHLVTSRGFSELMPFTNTRSGNRVGWYIGRVDNRLSAWDDISEAVYASKNLVLFNPTVANKEEILGKITKNPHIIVTGATGSGKSYLMQLLFLLMSFQNIKTLYIDPKKSIRRHWEEIISSPDYQERFPEWCEHISSFNFVTLDADKSSNYGVLDPIVILDNDDAVSTAKNILLYLLKRASDVKLDQTTAITEAVSQVLERKAQGEVVGFNQVVQVLCGSEDNEVASAGRYFRAMIKNSILELAFSDGDVVGLSYDHRVTVLEVADLSLPKDGAETISDHEHNSIVLMFALGAFCKHFGERSEEETVELFDEAWVLMQSAEGRAVIKSMRRVGRSHYNTLLLGTQSVHDAETDDDSTGFGTIFAFYEKSEREDILKHVGLEVTEENLEWIDGQISGQCLYYDVYGNLNRISVHNIHDGIDPLLKPMKQTVSSGLENKYAS